MRKYVLLTCILYLSCTNKNATNENTIEVLPYVDMLQQELKQIDSTPIALFMHNVDTVGNILDTTIIDKKDFRVLLQPFVTADISVAKRKKYFTESSYADAVNDSYNFAYTTNEVKEPVKSVILTTTSNDINSTFKSLLMTQQYNSKDTIINTNLFWKAKQYCIITTLKKINTVTFSSSKKIMWGMQNTTIE